MTNKVIDSGTCQDSLGPSRKRHDAPVVRRISSLQLLQDIANVARGLTATEEEKEAIERAAQRLERNNPNQASLSCPEINGKWELLYTTSASILGTNRPAFLRPRGPIYQIIGAAPPAVVPCLLPLHGRRLHRIAWKHLSMQADGPQER